MLSLLGLPSRNVVGDDDEPVRSRPFRRAAAGVADHRLSRQRQDHAAEPAAAASGHGATARSSSTSSARSALDHLLVEAVDGEVAVLASGCVCCAVRGDLEETLRELLAQRRPRRDSALRAHPDRDDRAWPTRRRSCSCSSTTRCSATSFGSTPSSRRSMPCRRAAARRAVPKPLKQAAIADRLLLTKTDLVGGRARRAARGAFAGSIPTLTSCMARSTRAALRRARSRRKPDVAWSRGLRATHQSPTSASPPSATCRYGRTLARAAAVTWRGPAARQRHPQSRGETAPVAIHGVHHVFHPPVLLNAWTDDDRRSRIVFITRGWSGQKSRKLAAPLRGVAARSG